MEKKIISRLLLLIGLFIVMNEIYKRWGYERDIQKHSEVVNLVRNIGTGIDILYIGESSNFTYRADDLDKRSISSFMGDHYPELVVGDISKHASHAGIYKVLLEQIPSDNTIKTLVVTLNLRSFNAQWIHSKLETPLQKSMVLLKKYPPLVNRFLLSFKGYDIKNEKERKAQVQKKWARDKFVLPFEFEHQNVIEWDRHIWKNGIAAEKGTFDKEFKELACHYVKGYAFQIDTLNNPRIKDFDDIVEIARNRKWNLVFNLLAENTQKADKLIGEELLYFMNENAKLLTAYFEKQGVVVVNNLHSVADEQFIDQDWTTEHYAEKGRKTIATNVAKGLKNWHADLYQEVDFEKGYQTEFFNDCEKDLIWGQLHTLTKEKSHSGKKSSKVGAGNDFSVSFQYPIKVIPDSLKNNLTIELWAFQRDDNHKAKLAIEARGEQMEYFWKAFDLKESINHSNEWQKYSLDFSIPQGIKQADVLKIYVYNPTESPIWVDDIRIQFR